MKILGIDPGYSNLGVCVLSEDESLEWYAYLSGKQAPRTSSCPDDFIARWYVRLKGICEKHHVTHIAYEDYVYQGNQRTNQPHSAKTLQQIGAFRVLNILPGIECVVTFQPSEWRSQLTGFPKAKDLLVAEALRLRLGIEISGPISKVSHILDACGVALTYLDRLRMTAGVLTN